MIVVYAIVIGGSIALALLVVATVYRQDYSRNDDRHAGRTSERPRMETEKVNHGSARQADSRPSQVQGQGRGEGEGQAGRSW